MQTQKNHKTKVSKNQNLNRSMSSSLALVSPPSSTMATRIINPHITTSLITTNTGRSRRRGMVRCKASPPSPSSSITEFDLYELLGIERSSGQPEIKKAYRSMQKRCHPDIAGSVGHDMAIVLNEAYALLSDPVSRSAYDKVQSKMVDVRGYTGKPVYSAWLGPESEQRAVFVDEVKCVGCLKCALFASKTFAIESAYGRARVVAQWADPETLIQESIDACPVNCISTVERSDLPALEFLMSKQPRGNVRIGVGNTVGARVTDVFTEAELFQRKLDSQNKNKPSSPHSTDLDIERNRTMSAIQAILSISNWLYQRPIDGSQPTQQGLVLTRLRLRSPDEPRLDSLKKAAAARRDGVVSRAAPSQGSEYWVPSTPVLPPGVTSDSQSHNNKPHSPLAAAASTETGKKTRYGKRQRSVVIEEKRWPLVWGIPAGASAIGAISVGLQGGRIGGVTEHAGGPLAIEIVNSLWLQAVLAGAAWYIAGFAIVRTIEAFGRHNTK